MKKKFCKKFIVAIVTLLSLLLVACQNKEVTELPVFKIGAIPDTNVSEIQENMTAMADYLTEELGFKVEFVPSNDYAALVTAFERGEIQLAWFGGLTGVQGRSVAPGSEAIAQRPKDAKFQSVFIAQKSLDLKSLEDTKGKTFTFGSESSTSGFLMPRYFLTQANIAPDTDFDGAPNYSGSHDKTIKLVESGAYQAGALNISVWEKFVEENQVDLSKVDVFYTTPEYFDYNWTVNQDQYMDTIYGEGTKAKLKDILLNMNQSSDERAQKVLAYYQTDKFIETNNDNYKAIEEVAKELGVIK